MGILDDAIREHLELKRRLGADDEELARLEGEAFGPASRPGDPDFPAQGQAATATATEAAIGGRPPAGDAQPTTSEGTTGPAAAPEPPAPSEPPASEPEAPSAPESEAPAALFHDQQAVEAAPEPERAAPEPEQGAQAPLTDERPAVEPSQTEHSALEPSDTGERPIESFDTVEHPFEQEAEDTGEAEVVEGELEQEEERGRRGRARGDAGVPSRCPGGR